MKTKIILMLGLVGLLFNSCTKDQEQLNVPSAKTEGVQFRATLGPTNLKTGTLGDRGANRSNHWGNSVLVGNVKLGLNNKQTFTVQDTNLKTASVVGDATTTWLNTDQVGIYMVNAGSPLQSGNIVSNADNVLYTAIPQADPHTATFDPSSVSTAIYYPVDASQSVNFIAYYPYNVNQTSNYVYPIDLTDQSASSSLASNDLLYANDGVACDKSLVNVNLKFEHVLSKLLLNIRAGSGLRNADLVLMTVTLDSLQGAGSLDLSSGFTTPTGTASTITAHTSFRDSLVESQALLLPQNNKAVVLKFTLADNPITRADSVAGRIFTWTLDASMLARFEAGTQYVFNVQLDAPTDFVNVVFGTFMMGSSTGDIDHQADETQHQVTLTKGYSIGKYPVTFADYDAYCDATSISKPDDHGWGRGNRPVINVSWDDANAYCAWLSLKTGHNYRLPTESEWEFAARGGNNSLSYKYSGSDNVDDVAWYNTSRTQPVGEKQANELGIYDMSGNVLEWCSDWYQIDYGITDLGLTSTDPQGPLTGSDRVVRGGYFADNAKGSRSANRENYTPNSAYSWIGFRVVLVP